MRLNFRQWNALTLSSSYPTQTSKFQHAGKEKKTGALKSSPDCLCSDCVCRWLSFGLLLLMFISQQHLTTPPPPQDSIFLKANQDTSGFPCHGLYAPPTQGTSVALQCSTMQKMENFPSSFALLLLQHSV